MNFLSNIFGHTQISFRFFLLIPGLSAACRPVPELFNVVIIKWAPAVGKFAANGLAFHNTERFITQQRFRNLCQDMPTQDAL